MIKHRVKYKNFNDLEVEKDLYFHITEVELTDNLHLATELEEMQERFKARGEDRNLTIPEIQEILNLVKIFVKLSYGIRSDDGEEFQKSPEIYEKFTYTAVYSAFLMDLFRNGDKAMRFLIDIMPANMRETAQAAADRALQGDGTVELATAPPVVDGTTTPFVEPTSTEPSDEELLAMRPQDMTHEQMMRAYRLKTQA